MFPLASLLCSCLICFRRGLNKVDLTIARGKSCWNNKNDGKKAVEIVAMTLEKVMLTHLIDYKQLWVQKIRPSTKDGVALAIILDRLILWCYDSLGQIAILWHDLISSNDKNNELNEKI